MRSATPLLALNQAVEYLDRCGILLPDFQHNVTNQRVGGSFVLYEPLSLTIGNYPTSFLRNWFTMHELGHLLWAAHRPVRNKTFRQYFGDARPEPRKEYERIHKRYSAITAATMRLSWWPGLHRPSGQPSHYGAHGGGEERFCELIALMYAHGDFEIDPPVDLEELWDVCWDVGLKRMI